nr:hypothetical protein [Tanacetum cinerariifolium]
LRKSGRRPGKEVIVEQDNDNKYIDVNDETSDDDFMDMGRNSMYASDLRKNGRRPGKEVIVKQDNDGKYIDVNDELSDDDFVDMGRNSVYASGDMLGLKNKRLDVLEGKTNRDDEMVRSWKHQYVNDKEITPADVKMRMRKSEEADLNFKLNFIVLFTSIMGNIRQKGMYYVDGTKCNDSIVCRRRPPMKVWTAELLSEREAEEVNCGGFGHGELEKKFVDEEGDPIPKNIEGCIWMLKNYVNNITNERKEFEKMLSAAEHMFPGNVNLIGFADKYINSLKCISGCNNSGTNAPIHQTEEKEKDVQGEDGFHNMNRVEAFTDEGYRAQRNKEVEVGASDIGVKNQVRKENMIDVLTQQAFKSVAKEVERSIEMLKNMETDDIPSFSVEGEASDVFMFHGRRVMSKSNIVRSPFYDRVVDVDAVLSSEENKSISGQQSIGLQMKSLGKDYVDSNILDTWAVVRNYLEEYRSNDSPLRLFLLTFVVDKDSFVVLNNDDLWFKRVVQHVESITKTRSELNNLKKVDLGMHNWDLRLDAKHGNLQKQLTILCKKYAAVILMADCDMMKTKVKAHMGTK